MLTFAKLNVNPRGKRTGDCVVRAIAEAASKSYEEVATDLFGQWMDKGYEMTDDKCVDAVLSGYGFAKFGKPFDGNGKTIRANRMDDVLRERFPNGCVAVVKVANHLTCVKGAYLVDLWDCGDKSVYGFWAKEDPNPTFTDHAGKPTSVRINL